MGSLLIEPLKLKMRKGVSLGIGFPGHMRSSENEGVLSCQLGEVPKQHHQV